MESMNMDIWVVGTSNQLFVKGSDTDIQFPKKKYKVSKLLTVNFAF